MLEPLETEEKTKTRKFKGILLITGMVVFVITTFTIPFLQVFFPVRSHTVEVAMDALEINENKIEHAESELRSTILGFHSNKIDEHELKHKIKKFVPLILDLEKESEVLTSKLKIEKDKDKVFGFRTMKVFFANLGMPLVSFLLGFLLLILYNKEVDFFLKKVIFAFGFIGTMSGLFYVIWVFYPEGDLPLNTYLFMQFFFSIIGAFIAFLVGKYFFNILQINLKIKIQNLLSFITKDIKRKYISSQDRQQYISDYLGEIEKLSEK